MGIQKLAVAIFATGLFGGAAVAAEVKVLAVNPVKEVVEAFTPAFEKATGHKVVATWTGGQDVRKRLAAGEVYDLVLTSAPDIDGFIKDGKVVAGSRTDLMKVGVGIAVKAGAPKPDVSSLEALKSTLLAAKSIGYSTGSSGTYIETMLANMGLSDQVKGKLKQVPSGSLVGDIIKSGEAEIGFQQVSELVHFPGITFLGPLPAAVQNVTQYSSALMTSGAQREAASELVKFLQSSAAAAAIRHHGMEPN
jgi:molybdate transport system substrate-binding protein